MPPILERTTVPLENKITLEIPEEYRNYTFKVVMIPIVKKAITPKYDFSDLVGKLNWSGDEVREQRRIRDEWE